MITLIGLVINTDMVPNYGGSIVLIYTLVGSWGTVGTNHADSVICNGASK